MHLLGPQPEELIFRQTPWVIGIFLRGWEMNVPLGWYHTLEADPRAFLDGVHPQIQQKLTEEVQDLDQWGKVSACAQDAASKDQPR